MYLTNLSIKNDRLQKINKSYIDLYLQKTKKKTE